MMFDLGIIDCGWQSIALRRTGDRLYWFAFADGTVARKWIARDIPQSLDSHRFHMLRVASCPACRLSD